MQTLLLDQSTWDLVLDANGNIAVGSEPYSLAQDAASAVKTFSDGGPNSVGECWWDTTVGVPWLTQILGQPINIGIIKAKLSAAALTVPDVSAAVVFISAFINRAVSGQVQVTSVTGQTSAANFSVTNPQGVG